MEVKLSEKLKDLPESRSKFWDGSVETRDMSEGTSHRHFFVRKGSRDIQCECGFGLWIDENDDLINGELYRFGEKISVN